MSYKTDQWYNLLREGENGSGETGFNLQAANSAGYYLEGPSTNDKFIYPDRMVRDMGGRNPAGVSKTLKRGYIRNLALGSDDEDLKAPPLRCQFQFNPVTILQTMSQASGVLNFLQQDLAQFAQPLMGQNSFSFELLFDRSMELNSSTTDNPDIDPASNDLWAQLPPQIGGVLHDLSRLYSIIGVGLSQELVNYATKVYARQAEAEISTKVQSGEDTSGISSLEENEATLAERINMNVGNSAILMPLPVRVVFSSLYIIEGLVSGVSVRFSKFNASMIPMQCAVTVSMQAMYVGFAREKTFFQAALQQLANYERQDAVTEQQAEYDAVSDIPIAVKEELSTVNLALYLSGDTRSKGYSPNFFGNTPATTLHNITSHYDGEIGLDPDVDQRDEQTSLKVYFPKVYSKGVNTSSVYTAIQQESLTVEVEWAHVRIYRYLDLVVPASTPDLLDTLKTRATTDKGSGTARSLVAVDYDDPVHGTAVTYKIPDVMLVREVILNSSNVGGGTPGIVSVSTLDRIGDFFGGPSGVGSMVYSIQQKGVDDRLPAQGFEDKLGVLKIDEDGGSSSAIDDRNKVRFLAHFRVVVALTDKNGVREKKSAEATLPINSTSDFYNKELKVADLNLDWNRKGPPFDPKTPGISEELISQIDELIGNGLLPSPDAVGP